MAPAGAPASPHHWFTCVCIVHIDIHIPANSIISSRQSDDDTRSLLRSSRGGAGGRARGHSRTGGRIATSNRNRPSGAAERGGRRREGRSGEHGRGRRKKTRRQNARTLNEHFELCIRTQCVSRCQDHSTPCLSGARASRGDRGYRMSRLLLASELLWVGVASEPLALRSVGGGVSALQRCVTGCSRAQRCPAHMLKDMDPITGQMQSSQRHSRLARRLQYAEARRVSSRNGL